MKALFLAQGPLEWAGSRYRAWWIARYAGWADCALISEREAAWMPAYGALIFPKWCDAEAQALAREAKARGQRVIWDLCDPIWWLTPGPAREFLPLVDHVVVSSQGLADGLRADFPALDIGVTVIPDRMDPAFHPTAKRHTETAWPALLWFGQGWNRNASLSGALLTLHRLAAEGVRFRLRVLDNGAPGGVQVDGVDVEYHRWRLETFHEELLAADVALCPPYPGPWGAMKSDNKLATAWWAGLPTADGLCPHRLKALLTDARARADAGRCYRRLAEAQYDVRQSVSEWEALLSKSEAR